MLLTLVTKDEPKTKYVMLVKKESSKHAHHPKKTNHLKVNKTDSNECFSVKRKGT